MEKERGGKNLKLHYHTQLKIPVATGCLGWIWTFIWNLNYTESTFFSFSWGMVG